MNTLISKETAEARVVQKYQKLYGPLLELVAALQHLEPGGTLVDNVTVTHIPEDRKVHITYAARPVLLTIEDGERIFMLRVVEGTSK